MPPRGLDAPLVAGSVAVVADVHGNVVALDAVAAEVLAAKPDAIVFLGDLTCGALPEETWAVVDLLCAEFPGPARFVRGNSERAMIEAAVRLEEHAEGLTEKELWLLEAHTAATLAAIAAFEPEVILNVAGLGPVRFCHGSPRSDEEMITPATPQRRIRELSGGVEERVLVTAHTHIQFDRRVGGIRSINPGSVGLPYEGRHGAFWALLGADAELCQTDYDLEHAVARMRETSAPFAEGFIDMLLAPPSREQVIAHAETLVYSG